MDPLVDSGKSNGITLYDNPFSRYACIFLFTRQEMDMDAQAIFLLSATTIQNYAGDMTEYQTVSPPSIQLFFCYIYIVRHIHGWFNIYYCGLTAGMFWLPTNRGLLSAVSICFHVVVCLLTVTISSMSVCVSSGAVSCQSPDMLVWWNFESKHNIAVKPIQLHFPTWKYWVY